MSVDPQEEEQEPKPKKVLIEVSIPTADSIIAGIKNMFPTVAVKIIEDEDQEPTQP